MAPMTATKRRRRVVLSVVNLKGGTAKTTSAAHCARALHEQGYSVLLVDLDPQRSALTWSELAEFPFPTIGLGRRLAVELGQLLDGKFDAAVLDTPPTEDRLPLITAALGISTHVLVPCSPTKAEYERLRVLWPVLDDAAAQMHEPFAVAVVLVRTQRGVRATADHQEAMTADGWRVLKTTIPSWQRYAQAFSEPLPDSGHYGDVVTELMAAGR